MSHKRIKRNISGLMALLLCLALVIAAAPAAFAAGGSCGDDLTWSFQDGTLTVFGSGAMSDFAESTMAPWHSLRGEIRKLVLPEGLTHIGALAFYECTRLTVVDLPEGVVSIGAYAFARCQRLQLLDLGKKLQSIGADAFHGCWALDGLHLPQSLKVIGEQAFYDCAALTSVVIPAGVEQLGDAAFAYCTSLVRAEIRTKLTVLPEWTFFGCRQLDTLILPDTITSMENAALRECDNLHTVSYGGDSITLGELKEIITEDVPGFGGTGFVTNENPGASSTSGSAVENEDGSVTEQLTTVITGNDSTVSATTDRTYGKEEGDTLSSDITVTVENDEGWDEATQGVQSALDQLNNRVQPGVAVGTTNVTVYVKDSDQVSGEFVDSLAGNDVILTVVTKDGSSWIIDCSTMVKQELAGAYDLRYTVEPADADALELLGVTQAYRIRFASDAKIETELLIALPNSAANQTATFFKKTGNKSVTRYQSVLVDRESYAHLYLASVKGNADYYLAINAPDAKEEAIIPDTMQGQAYPKLEHTQKIRYEVTGRESSWGVGLGTVMGIMAAVMVTVVAIVGVALYIWNKKRIRSGYVAGWDDYDEEE